MPEFKYTARYYENVDHSWSCVSTPIISRRTRQAIQTAQIPTNARLLDLGCGNGDYGTFLSDFGTVYGMDFSPDAIKNATGKYQALLSGTAEQIPLQSRSVDVVFCSEMLEHILDWHRVIKEIKRILKPGGLLIMTTTLYSTSINLLLLRKPPIQVLLPNICLYLAGYISPSCRSRFIMRWAFESLGGHYHGFLKKELCNALKEEQYTLAAARVFYAYPPVFLAQGANLKDFWYRSPKTTGQKLLLLPLVTALWLFNLSCKKLGLFANNIFLAAEKREHE